MKKRKGFTLAELLAVIVILGIITSITVPIVTDQIDKYKTKVCVTQYDNILNAARSYGADHLTELGKNKTITLKTLNDDGYIDASNMKDPITKNTISQDLKIIIEKVGKKYKKDLNILLENIENKDKSLEELIINNENEYERIFDLTIHNKTYIDIAKNMSALELMLLITSYIFVPFTPNIDQDGFNDLVNVAKNYDNSLENIWRLGMNYDRKGYNFDLLDNFFVDSKNVYYLGEYISLIHQINQEKIVNTIVKTKDKGFIKQILENDTIVDNLDEEYKNILKSSI